MEEGESDEKTFFICEVCSEMFNEKSGLESHQKDKHAIKRFKCAVCVTYFEKHEHLLEHMQNHVAAFLFKCQNCGKTFSNITDLRLHMEEHVFIKKYVCCLCTDKFGNIDIFQLHLRKIHDIKSNPKTNQDVTNTGTALVDNVVSSKEYRCEFCDADFENDQLLFSHVKDHAKRQKNSNAKLATNVLRVESNVNFKIAEVSSVSNSSLSSIAPISLPGQNTSKINQSQGNKVIVVQKTDEGQFACQLCQKTFAFQENLLLHLKTHPTVMGNQQNIQTIVIQTPSKPYRYEKDQYPCLKCNESFAFEENLHLHLKTHSEGESTSNSDKKSMMQCDECGIFILDPKEFALHLEMHQDFKCATCGEEFADPFEFDNHERTHLISDLTCVTCKEQFPCKDSLNLHRKIRHEKKTLMCGVCGDVLGNHELKNHMKTHLKSPKTEKCGICNETVLKSKFAAHMEMHDMTDFYYCDVCDDEFDCEEEFQVHLSSHFICKICKKLFNFQSQLDEHLLSHNQKCKICDIKFDSDEQLKEHANIHGAKFEESQSQNKGHKEESETIQPSELMAILTDQSFMVSKTVSHDHGSLVTKNRQKSFVDGASTEKLPTADTPLTSGVPFRSKITCDYCPKRFRFAFAYENHLKDHPKKCKDCGQIFRKLQMLRAHELSDHHSKKKDDSLPPQNILHKCNLCSRKFQTETKLIEHKKTHTISNGLNGNNITSSQTDKHEQTEANKEQQIKKEVEDFSEDLDQKDQEDQTESLKCHLCQLEIPDDSTLKDHMEAVHSYVCDICHTAHNSITELNSHQFTHHASGVLRCSYNECDVKFETENEMKEHVKAHHSVSIPLSLDITILPNSVKTLDSSFTEAAEQLDSSIYDDKQTIASEVKYSNIHEEHDEKNIIEIQPLEVAETTLACELCSTSVVDETDLQHHMKAIHKNIKFRCDVCLILFSTRASYDTHRQRHFQKTDSFVCTAKRCGARFSSSEALNEHAQGHTLKREIKESLLEALQAKKRRIDTVEKLGNERDEGKRSLEQRNNKRKTITQSTAHKDKGTHNMPQQTAVKRCSVRLKKLSSELS